MSGKGGVLEIFSRRQVIENSGPCDKGSPHKTLLISPLPVALMVTR